ncbi:sensor histidine kinase [Paenibacillus sp. J31TS4]|uniref:cache domain-containing sensor histidine kinase n=1 Tax=Paenibacillus sp. J31TS4 TaxID=2807195 RepID=UPI001B16B55E|nr:sensor histidine kinase [Paenibacillus sp. J31TS4]GIP37778.1 sensor histidine kinase [Paenibacillus sp. J31TS4]
MKAFFRPVQRFLADLRIKYKLLLSFGLLIAATVGLISYISYQKTAGLIEEQVVESTGKSFEQASQFISYKLDNVKDVSSMLFMDKTLNEILIRGEQSYPLGEQIDDYWKLQDIIRSVSNSREIYSTRLFVRTPAIYSREDSTFLDMKPVVEERWYKDMLTNTDGIYCQGTYEYDYKDSRGKQSILSCLRPLLDNGYTGSPIGVVAIDVLESSISDIIRQTNITRNGQVYLIDREGTIISGLDSSRIGTKLDALPGQSGLFKTDKGTETVKWENHASKLIYRQIQGTNWKLVALIPEKELTEPSSMLASYQIAVLAIVLLLAAVIAVWLAENLTRRIRLLVYQFGKIEVEKWDVRQPVDSSDELGVLQSSFYRMSDTMQRLIKEKYQEEVLKKSAELKALQAQINPHFLYNTLDMIHWLAMKHRAPEISSVVGSLAKFFRLSLSKGRDIITIGEEIEHVRTYLEIQNKRFGGRIRHEVDLDPGLEQYATVKIVLQPIVENSVLHGIQEREDKTGTIRITGRLENGRIVLVVEDDGVGMTQQQLERLAGKDPDGGYGIQNVMEKIKLYYGEEYGLSFASEPGRGTRVTVVFPALPPGEAPASGDEDGHGEAGGRREVT